MPGYGAANAGGVGRGERISAGSIEVTASLAHVCDVDLVEALTILGSRDMSPVIDRVLPLEPLGTGTVTGKILVNPQTG